MLSISCGNANQYYWTREERDEYFAAQKKEQEERVSQDQVKLTKLWFDIRSDQTVQHRREWDLIHFSNSIIFLYFLSPESKRTRRRNSTLLADIAYGNPFDCSHF